MLIFASTLLAITLNIAVVGGESPLILLSCFFALTFIIYVIAIVIVPAVLATLPIGARSAPDGVAAVVDVLLAVRAAAHGGPPGCNGADQQ